jgi:hypothetical protein
VIGELGDDPNRSDIQWRLGSVLASQGKTQEAAQQYLASLRIQPTPEAFSVTRSFYSGAGTS